ncbi:MAG TPA: hypothetical protein VIW92_04345, partial [Thermoanaerobaculia bacterium]
MAGRGAQASVGLIGPATSVETVRKALEAAGGGFEWIEGDEAWWADVVLWVVDVEEGVPDEERERARAQFSTPRVELTVLIDGIDRIPEDEAFVPDLVELDIRDLLAETRAKAFIVRGSARRALEEPQSKWVRTMRYLAERLEPSVKRGPAVYLGVDGTRGASLELGETPEAWV